MARLLPPLRPVPKQFRISQRWGVRHIRYSLGYHTGTDFAAPIGTRVRAPRSGKVLSSSYSANDYGHHVIMKDWLGRKGYLVAHLSRRSVREGQYVARGQTLGYSGNSGMSTAPHVHAEQRRPPFAFINNEKPDWE